MANNQYTIQPGQILGGIASQFGTTTANLQALNPNITNPNLIFAGSNLNVPGMGTTPIMNTNVLQGNNQQPALPPAVQPATGASFVQATQLPPLQLAPANASVGAQEGTLSAAQKRILELSGKLIGQGTEQKRLEEAQGIPGFNKQVTDLTNKLNTQRAAFDAQANQISAQAGTQEGLIGSTARLRREEAIDVGITSAALSAAQGNLTNARAEVDRTLKFEFDPIKQEIENTKLFIDMNYKNLDRADKKVADALKIKLDRENRALDFLYDIKKSAYDKVIKEGGSPEQLNAITKAKSAEDIIKSFGTSIISAATPTLSNGKPDVVSELANTLKFSGKDVPGASAALSVLTNVQKLALANQDGTFVGLGRNRSPINLRSGEARKEFVANKSDIAALKGTVSKWLSGLTLSKQQEKDILKIVPNVGDTQFQIRTKLNSLASFMQGQAKSELAAKGVNYTPTIVDYFATPTEQYVNTAVEQATDPYEIYLKEQIYLTQ